MEATGWLEQGDALALSLNGEETEALLAGADTVTLDAVGVDAGA
jgi:hypothetical protein